MVSPTSALGCLALILLMVGCSHQRVLRVCADPNNLPFSNSAEEGFENRLASMVARDLGARVEYTWFPQRRGFVRNTLNARVCDVVMGVPAGYEMVTTTRPYYRSSYVFVSRPDVAVASLDDPLLRRVHIGAHVIGDDYANPPPLMALARRNIVRNVSGFSIYGDYSLPNPTARVVEAVASREIDVAIVWGPIGGYFGSRLGLRVTSAKGIDIPKSPDTMSFQIAMGVRKEDTALRDRVQGILDARRLAVARLLTDYKVPVL